MADGKTDSAASLAGSRSPSIVKDDQKRAAGHTKSNACENTNGFENQKYSFPSESDSPGLSRLDAWRAEPLSSLVKLALPSEVVPDYGPRFEVEFSSSEFDERGETESSDDNHDDDDDEDGDDASSISARDFSDAGEDFDANISMSSEDGSICSGEQTLQKYLRSVSNDRDSCSACLLPLWEWNSTILVCPNGHAAHSSCWFRWESCLRERRTVLSCMQCRMQLEFDRLDFLQAEKEYSMLEAQQ